MFNSSSEVCYQANKNSTVATGRRRSLPGLDNSLRNSNNAALLRWLKNKDEQLNVCTRRKKCDLLREEKENNDRMARELGEIENARKETEEARIRAREWIEQQRKEERLLTKRSRKLSEAVRGTREERIFREKTGKIIYRPSSASVTFVSDSSRTEQHRPTSARAYVIQERLVKSANKRPISAKLIIKRSLSENRLVALNSFSMPERSDSFCVSPVSRERGSPLTTCQIVFDTPKPPTEKAKPSRRAWTSGVSSPAQAVCKTRKFSARSRSTTQTQSDASESITSARSSVWGSEPEERGAQHLFSSPEVAEDSIRKDGGWLAEPSPSRRNFAPNKRTSTYDANHTPIPFPATDVHHKEVGSTTNYHHNEDGSTTNFCSDKFQDEILDKSQDNILIKFWDKLLENRDRGEISSPGNRLFHEEIDRLNLLKIEATPSPKADSPKADSPKADSPKADSPKADSPKADSPKAYFVKKFSANDDIDSGGAPPASAEVPKRTAAGESYATIRQLDAERDDVRACSSRDFQKSFLKAKTSQLVQQLLEKTCKALDDSATRASSAAGDVPRASSGAGDVSRASSAAGDVSRTSSAADDASRTSSDAGDVSRASSAAGEVSRASSAAGDVSRVSSAAGDVSRVSSAAGDVSRVSSEEKRLEVSESRYWNNFICTKFTENENRSSETDDAETKFGDVESRAHGEQTTGGLSTEGRIGSVEGSEGCCRGNTKRTTSSDRLEERWALLRGFSAPSTIDGKIDNYATSIVEKVLMTTIGRLELQNGDSGNGKGNAKHGKMRMFATAAMKQKKAEDKMEAELINEELSDPQRLDEIRDLIQQDQEQCFGVGDDEPTVSQCVAFLKYSHSYSARTSRRRETRLSESRQLSKLFTGTRSDNVQPTSQERDFGRTIQTGSENV